MDGELNYTNLDNRTPVMGVEGLNASPHLHTLYFPFTLDNKVQTCIEDWAGIVLCTLPRTPAYRWG
jgi:hypothetical protein